jgi:hypothetical protein
MPLRQRGRYWTVETMLPSKSRANERLRDLKKSPTVTFPKYEKGVVVYATAKKLFK